MKWWNLINHYKHLEGGCKAEGTRLFSVVPSNRTRGSMCKFNTKEHFSTATEAKQWKRSQGGCGVLILGHIQKPSGHGPLAPGPRLPRQVNDSLRVLAQRVRINGVTSGWQSVSTSGDSQAQF